MSESTLRELLADVAVDGDSSADARVTGVAYRSDRVRPGDAFFCVPGFAHDGHEFAAEAVSRGASALVVQHRVSVPIAQFVVADTRVALAHAASRFYGQPSHDIAICGVTGTNGKTTTTYLLDAIARDAGMATGIVGTVETRVGDRRQESGRTTPESADLQRLFAQMRDSGVQLCSMEVSSHAIDLRRVDGIRFAVAAFTNLTQDHLDFHHTLAEYSSVKKRLFTEHEVGTRVINIDDPFGENIAAEADGVLTVGRAPDAAVRALDETLRADGSSFTLQTPGSHVRIDLPLAGAFNVSNALVAAGCALALGIDEQTIVRGLEAAPQVPGRLERIDCGQPFSVVVDYAHTPDSLEKAIAAVRRVTEGRVLAVFGCGGDRDPAKRSLMGSAAGRGADHTIVTSDNPRTEDPVAIILQIEDGLRETSGSYEVVVDRRRAIETALTLARPGDTVLIAGKGHEDYQEFAEHRMHFDDREVAREVLATC